jgi:hypothetical protein
MNWMNTFKGFDKSDINPAKIKKNKSIVLWPEIIESEIRRNFFYGKLLPKFADGQKIVYVKLFVLISYFIRILP